MKKSLSYWRTKRLHKGGEFMHLPTVMALGVILTVVFTVLFGVLNLLVNVLTKK